MQHETIFFRKPITNGINHTTPDELDLLNLFQKGIRFVNTYKFILVSFLIAGLTSGLYFYYNAPKQFSTRLIVRPWFLNQTGLLSNQEEIEIINNWKNLISKGEKEQLASIMNCDVNVIKKLSSISAEEILRTYVPNNPNGFLINVSVTDTSILNELQNGIVYALNNSPYSKEKIETRKQRDMELIAKVQGEVSKLNATKNLIDSMIKTQGFRSASLLVDISRINAEWIELNEKLLGYQEDLKFLSGVQVLANFNSGKLTRSGLLKFSFLGTAAGGFIGYIISMLLYVMTKMKESQSRSDENS